MAMTMTTQITHTIRCDTSWCSSPALASTPETALRATALGVPSAMMHAADAIALSWAPSRDIHRDDLYEIKWTCPSCQLVAPTAIDPHDRPRSDPPDHKQHSYRCACFRGSSAPWGPDEDCTCGLVDVGKAIVLGTPIVVFDTGARWTHAGVTAPATQFDGREFEYTLIGGSVPRRERIANFKTSWRFQDAPTAATPAPVASESQKHKDRITAVLALPQESTWAAIVSAVEHLVLPDRKQARDKAAARDAWRAVYARHSIDVEVDIVDETFEAWWRLRP